MYHYLRVTASGGRHADLCGERFECTFEAAAARVGDVNACDVIARGIVGDRAPIAVVSHGRLKVTIELLPEKP